jgi:hypothetical protein
MELSFWPRLALCALACWRVTHLLALEDGPAELVLRLRRHLGESWAGRLMDCFYCLSIWVAMPLALLLADGVPAWLLATLALSGAASLLERATARSTHE